jgi:hypothetical protein
VLLPPSPLQVTQKNDELQEYAAKQCEVSCLLHISYDELVSCMYISLIFLQIKWSKQEAQSPLSQDKKG